MCELPFNSENHYHFSISTTRLKLLCVIQCLVLKGNKVLIVIGGDDNYRDEDEEEQVVISRWARRKVASQFDEEYLNGRKSFIFFWNKGHREIHEKALEHYLDPSKKERKFQYVPKQEPTTFPLTVNDSLDKV